MAALRKSLAAAALSGALIQCAQANTHVDWPLWQAYAAQFIQHDGRVVEFSADARTTSEGQAYALFFALVANDRRRFENILHWTETNLADGALGKNLPAWLWGRDPNGAWKILDTNAASDADLWLSYALLEAGRLWKQKPYSVLGEQLLELIVAREVVELPNLGPALLPGPHGFALPEHQWRLNLSYTPLPLLRRFSEQQPKGPWQRIAETTVYLAQAASSHGLVPDWLAYDAQLGVIADPVKGPLGSYDAIRVYLWAGMIDAHDPLAAPLRNAVAGMAQLMRRSNGIPETVNTATGEAFGYAPIGFSAAVLTYLNALGEKDLLAQHSARLAAAQHQGLVGETPLYYDQNLALFGTGWFERRFRFDVRGYLMTSWRESNAKQNSE